MSVAPKAVLGWVPLGTLAPWWEPTKVGAPLTPRQAFFLRRRMWSSTPGTVQKALAERGLLTEGLTGTDRLTPEGHRLHALLGEVPAGYWPNRRTDRYYYQTAPSMSEATCPRCGREVNAELFAWDLYDGAPDAAIPPCLKCALKGLDRG